MLNVFGWVYISIRKPFDVKDRIEVFFPDHRIRGDVIDIRLSMFSLLEVGNWVDAEQEHGAHHPPAQLVRLQPPAGELHAGLPLLWNEIAVTVTFESNWERAHAILTRIVSEHSKGGRARGAEPGPRDVHALHGVLHALHADRVGVGHRHRRDADDALPLRHAPAALVGTRALVGRGCARSRKHNDIDFAYPTTRFYDNADEGKRPLRAEPNAPAATIHTPPGRSRTVPERCCRARLPAPSRPPRRRRGMPAVPTVSSTTSPPEAPVELAPIGTSAHRHRRTARSPCPRRRKKRSRRSRASATWSPRNHLEEETGIWDLKKLRELAAEYESGQVPPQTPSAEPGSDGDTKSKS